MTDKPEPYLHVPYDIEVEQALLGAMLRDNKQIDRAAADVEAVDFYDPLHGRLFEMIVYLVNEGDVNPLILHSVMKSDPGVLELGGQAYFEELFLAAPSMPNVRDYCNILKDLSMRRRMIVISEDLANDAQRGPAEMTAQAGADRATEALLAAGRAVAKPVMSIHDIAMESLRAIEKAALGEPIPSVKTGYTSVDDEFGGLRGGDFIILPGKSGMGKSALAVGLSRNTAKAGVPTLVFSPEMMRAQWAERMVCDEDFDTAPKGLWYSRVRNGHLNPGEFERFQLATQRLDGIPLEIRDEDDLNVLQMNAIARAFKARHGGKLGIVIVDYLQIVNPLDARENRERQVASIARGLKSMAKRLDWPVVALSQFNENDAQRSKEEKRPQLGDLRESKVIGQEADLVLSPHRPAYYVENRKPEADRESTEWKQWAGELATVAHRFELITLKNRHGRRADFTLWCDIGSNAIRDSQPRSARTAIDQHVADLLDGQR